MSDIIKICTKHGELKIDQVFKEKNKSRKGFLLRCNQCKLEKDRRWKEANREIHRASAVKSRNEKRKLFREGNTNERSIADIWAENDRKNDPEKYKVWGKKSKDKNRIINREKEICRVHGITLEEYRKIKESHNALCSVCNKKESRIGRDGKTITPLCIDHCHKCREKKKDNIRGLLCHSCNTGLGKFFDNIELLKNAIKYLEKHQCN